jgi:hypothetical protein
MSSAGKTEEDHVPSYDDFKFHLDRAIKKEQTSKVTKMEELARQLSALNLSTRVHSKTREKTQ